MDSGVNKVYVALDTSGNPRAWCLSCLVAPTLFAFRDACDVRDAIGAGMRRQPTSKQVDLGVRACGSTKLESSALGFGHNLCRSGHLWETHVQHVCHASTFCAFRDARDVRDATGAGMPNQPTSTQVDSGVNKNPPTQKVRPAGNN